MIKAKKGIFHIKNRETGEFEDVVAVKGDKGDGADVVIKDTFFTSETGDSEELAMTQKGVTILYDRILNGNDTVEHALLGDRALNADNADSATKAEQDAKGNIIDETYATLTNVNGSILSTNILDKAVELIGDGTICKIEHRYISISDAQWVEGDFDIPEGAARYGYVTFFIRWAHATVWLWGGYGSSVYYNSYGNGKWVGWRKVIDSNNIGEQSVNSANHIPTSLKLTNEYTPVWFAKGATGSERNKPAYTNSFAYNPSEGDLKVTSINGENINAVSKVTSSTNTISQANRAQNICDAPVGKTTEDIVAIGVNGVFGSLYGVTTPITNYTYEGTSAKEVECSGIFYSSKDSMFGFERIKLFVFVKNGKVVVGRIDYQANHLDGSKPIEIMELGISSRSLTYCVHFK